MTNRKINNSSRRRLIEIVGTAIFLICAITGVFVGFYTLFIWHDDSLDSLKNDWAARGIGVLCCVFYGGLLMLCINKIRNKSWGEFWNRIFSLKRKKPVRNSKFDNYVREFASRHDILLIGSLIIFGLAIFGWCMSYFAISHEVEKMIFLDLVFFAPSFVLLSLLDIFKRGFTVTRIVALLCSAFALLLLAIWIYAIIHQT